MSRRGLTNLNNNCEFFSGKVFLMPHDETKGAADLSIDDPAFLGNVWDYVLSLSLSPHLHEQLATNRNSGSGEGDFHGFHITNDTS